jgi:hypothetical protein
MSLRTAILFWYQASGGDAKLHIFDGKTHTSPIVEDPLLGKDMMADYILTMVRALCRHPSTQAHTLTISQTHTLARAHKI